MQQMYKIKVATVNVSYPEFKEISEQELSNIVSEVGTSSVGLVTTSDEFIVIGKEVASNSVFSFKKV